jgi:hypothetical protein
MTHPSGVRQEQIERLSCFSPFASRMHGVLLFRSCVIPVMPPYQFPLRLLCDLSFSIELRADCAPEIDADTGARPDIGDYFWDIDNIAPTSWTHGTRTGGT